MPNSRAVWLPDPAVLESFFARTAVLRRTYDTEKKYF